MNDGYIKLHRKMLKWQWFQDSNTVHIFLALLLDTNYEDKKVGFQEVKRGQCLTSIKRLQELTKLTPQKIRTCLSHLEKSGEINKQTTSRYSIITIKNYDVYQEIDKQVTSKQQTSNNIKEIKERKEYKESISKDIPKKVFSKPTIQEITEYCEERNNDVNPSRFYDFYESKDWYVGKNKMKDWKACVRTWERREKPKEILDEEPKWFNQEIKKGKDCNEIEKILEEFK